MHVMRFYSVKGNWGFEFLRMLRASQLLKRGEPTPFVACCHLLYCVFAHHLIDHSVCFQLMLPSFRIFQLSFLLKVWLRYFGGVGVFAVIRGGDGGSSTSSFPSPSPGEDPEYTQCNDRYCGGDGNRVLLP